METAALIATAALQIVENFSMAIIFAPAMAWAAVWGDCGE